MAIESVIFFVPSEVVMPLAGWLLVKDEGLNEPWLFMAAAFGALGSLIGAWVIYAIGAWGGRPLLLRYGRYLLITPQEIESAEAWFDRYGTWAVFFSRLVPVVRSFISLPAGITHMPLLSFTVLTFVGSFIWALGLAWAGYILGENYDEIRAWMRPVEIPIIVAVVLAAAWYLYRRVRAVYSQPVKSTNSPEETSKTGPQNHP
jgi:membrane protein DedA with SNARE-associated domain